MNNKLRIVATVLVIVGALVAPETTWAAADPSAAGPVPSDTPILERAEVVIPVQKEEATVWAPIEESPLAYPTVIPNPDSDPEPVVTDPEPTSTSVPSPETEEPMSPVSTPPQPTAEPQASSTAAPAPADGAEEPKPADEMVCVEVFAIVKAMYFCKCEHFFDIEWNPMLASPPPEKKPGYENQASFPLPKVNLDGEMVQIDDHPYCSQEAAEAPLPFVQPLCRDHCVQQRTDFLAGKNLPKGVEKPAFKYGIRYAATLPTGKQTDGPMSKADKDANGYKDCKEVPCKKTGEVNCGDSDYAEWSTDLESYETQCSSDVQEYYTATIEGMI